MRLSPSPALSAVAAHPRPLAHLSSPVLALTSTSAKPQCGTALGRQPEERQRHRTRRPAHSRDAGYHGPMRSSEPIAREGEEEERHGRPPTGTMKADHVPPWLCACVHNRARHRHGTARQGGADPLWPSWCHHPALDTREKRKEGVVTQSVAKGRGKGRPSRPTADQRPGRRRHLSFCHAIITHLSCPVRSARPQLISSIALYPPLHGAVQPSSLLGRLGPAGAT